VSAQEQHRLICPDHGPQLAPLDDVGIWICAAPVVRRRKLFRPNGDPVWQKNAAGKHVTTGREPHKYRVIDTEERDELCGLSLTFMPGDRRIPAPRYHVGWTKAEKEQETRRFWQSVEGKRGSKYVELVVGLREMWERKIQADPVFAAKCETPPNTSALDLLDYAKRAGVLSGHIAVIQGPTYQGGHWAVRASAEAEGVLVLSGSTGSGKTVGAVSRVIAEAFFAASQQRPFSAHFAHAVDLAGRRWWEADGDSYRAFLLRVRVLVIDDIDKENSGEGSRFASEFARLIDVRAHGEKLTTIMTTELDRERFRSRYGAAIDRRIGRWVQS